MSLREFEQAILGLLPKDLPNVSVLGTDDHSFTPLSYRSVEAFDEDDSITIVGECRHGGDFSLEIYPPPDGWRSLLREPLREFLRSKLVSADTNNLQCRLCDHPPCCSLNHH